MVLVKKIRDNLFQLNRFLYSFYWASNELPRILRVFYQCLEIYRYIYEIIDNSSNTIIYLKKKEITVAFANQYWQLVFEASYSIFQTSINP